MTDPRRVGPSPRWRATLARLDTPVACLLVAMLGLALFTVGLLARFDFDPSAFIVAGDRYSDAREVPAGVAVSKGSEGYDGQFYYRLALDPFTSKDTDFGITFDRPAYRHQRILYPLIVHLTSFGDAQRVPIAMIAINFVFFGLMAWICGTLARRLHRHALWGLLIVGFPGFLIVYSRDLVEIVDATFVLGSVLLIGTGRPRWATLALTLAVLTRETSLIVAVAAALVFAWDRLRGRTTSPYAWCYFTGPLVAFCTLQWALFTNWGRVPVLDGHPVLAAPSLIGFTTWSSGVAAASTDRFVQTVALTFVGCSALLVAVQLFTSDAGRIERLACILYGLLVAALGTSVWIEDIAFLRVYTQAYVFGAIVVLASRSNVARWALTSLVVVTWGVEFGRLVAVRHFLRSVFGG